MMKIPAMPANYWKTASGPTGWTFPLQKPPGILGVSRVTLSRVVNTRAAISPDLAVPWSVPG